MTSIRQIIAEIDPELVLLDPPDAYDKCIIGIASRIGQEDCIAYDRDKVIRELMSDGMNEEDAEDFFSFNIAGAYVGARTPIFIDGLSHD
jgi:hypothetical protein